MAAPSAEASAEEARQIMMSRGERRRAVVGLQMEWSTRKCDAGTYQLGDACLPCPASSYSLARFRAVDRKSVV